MVAAAGAVLAAIAVAGWSPPAATAAACPNAAYRTGPSANLPGCRAYELVSPADKSANTLTVTMTAGAVVYPSVSGNQAYFGAVTPFADPKSGAPAQYVAVRGTDGWATRDIKPANCAPDIVGLQSSAPLIQGLSRDLSTGIATVGPEQNCYDPNDHAGTDIYRVDADGSLHWVSQNGSPKTADAAAAYAGASADASHILFTSGEMLVPGAADDRVGGSSLYDRTGGRTIDVGVGDDGKDIGICGTRLAGSNGGVSADGRVVFFTTQANGSQPGCDYEDGAGQIYARIDDATTIHISTSLVGSVPSQPPKFLGATDDGAHVFFTAAKPLDGSAGSAYGGLYEYDLSPVLDGTATTGTLTFLSPDSTDVSGYPYGPQIGTVDFSEDGSVVYFTAGGTLDGTSPATSGSKLYRDGPGGLEYIGPVSGSLVSASADGSKVAFSTPTSDGTAQIALYDADGPGGVTCVSCPAGGAASVGNASFEAGSGVGRPEALGVPRYVTDDGRVFFTSSDQLAPRDVNDHRDVYEYVDGTRVLISSGTSSYDAMLAGVTDDGRDVFFLTNDSLTTRDFDNGDQDLYDARVGGGFAQATIATACDGVACRPPASAPPLVPVAATLSFVGPVPSVPESGPSQGKKPKAKVRRRMTVRTAAFRVAVRVGGKGRIAITGRGVRTARRTVSRAGTYRVRVVLNKRARKVRRARGGALHLRVRVAFRPAGGRRAVRVVRVTVKHPKASTHQRQAHRGAAAKSGR